MPLHEVVQSTEFLDQRLARSQREMIGVGEHDLRARVSDLGWGHRLERTMGSDRHEGRRFDRSMRRLEARRAGTVARCLELEGKAIVRRWVRGLSRGHGRSVAGEPITAASGLAARGSRRAYAEA